MTWRASCISPCIVVGIASLLLIESIKGSALL